MLTCEEYDNAIRWNEGERLEHLFEQRCDALARQGLSDHPAVVAGSAVLSYRQLDEQANQLARYLRRIGVKPADRVGILVNKTAHTYVSLLAILKAGAAFVPLDASFPPERLAFILSDAEVDRVLTLSHLRDRLDGLAASRVCLDAANDDIKDHDPSRLRTSENGHGSDALAYIIYTSGSTGNPKGVAIEHPSICNFVRAAGEVYGIRKDDRVFQGMTIAFDFSAEEIWVPLIAGATLVPGRPDATLVGEDLADFLGRHRVTALCCVPTLLSTIERDIPELRFLLLSGEACPADLASRWHRPGRTILNAYGPTEATVTATVALVRPGAPVTIGKPLPTYSIVILDEHQQPVCDGTAGEICIAGIGLAKGYVNRDDLTRRSFIRTVADLPSNPSKRLYRTGDLGRITDNHEVEYLGRIDTQVKIRGYRIELTEIESVLLRVPQIAQAVVDTHAPREGGPVELVAYYTLKSGQSQPPTDEISITLRRHLPGYMIPAFVEQVASLPMLPSNKVDRKKLPPPEGPRFVTRDREFVAPNTPTEQVIAKTMATILDVDRVSLNDNFFQDLGAHSLLMAQFCATFRQQSPEADISMREVYQYPTVEQLAGYLDSQPKRRQPCTSSEGYRIPTNLEYCGCGALQMLLYAFAFTVGFFILVKSVPWMFAGTTWADLYARMLALSVGFFVLSSALPIALKWLLIGKWQAERFPVWSLRYLAFWVVKRSVSVNPMALFKGLPLYNVYLRLLGAKIGKHAVILADGVPLCTDLLTIGDNSLLDRGSSIQGYKAVGGYIYTGAIHIGSNVYVGDTGLLDINTTLEDNTQLGHGSSVHENQTVPAGKRYHGAPAVETTTNYCSVPPKTCTTLRRAVYTALPLLEAFVLAPPVAACVLQQARHRVAAETGKTFLWGMRDLVLRFDVAEVALASLGLLLVGIVVAVLVVGALPRLLNLFIQEGRTYVLFGVHYWLAMLNRAVSNSAFLNLLFGDSSAIVYYLKWIGYDLSGKLVQSGSNFGVMQKHDNPLLCRIGSATMVSDGLFMMNMRMSNTSFVTKRVTIGAHNYLGNGIHYPPDGKTGDNCLLGTKVMIPIDGPVRENVGLLGSPCFEIPRVVNRDRDLSLSLDEPERQRRINRKNLHNFVTVLGFLFFSWLGTFGGLILLYYGISLFASFGLPALAATFILAFVFAFAYGLVLDRVAIVLSQLTPMTISLYDRQYWRTERYWKLTGFLGGMFGGTPVANLITRLSGIKIGRKTFDDGLFVTEKPLATIGDYCTFNRGCTLQSHSLEEGVFKCDHIRVGSGCTLGVGAFVHYGTTLEDNVVVEQDCFLMKGETAAANSTWRGNPAMQV